MIKWFIVWCCILINYYLCKYGMIYLLFCHKIIYYSFELNSSKRKLIFSGPNKLLLCVWEFLEVWRIPLFNQKSNSNSVFTYKWKYWNSHGLFDEHHIPKQNFNQIFIWCWNRIYYSSFLYLFNHASKWTNFGF